jgi:hypothetical protein
MELKELKEEYGKLIKEYNLPSFRELEEEFEVSKLEKESESVLRAVRKTMMEKIMNSLGFVEMMLNPMNAPQMYFVYLNSMSSEDKKSIEKIYEVLAELSIASLEREVDYDEKEEAELIKRILKTWNGIKPEFRMVLKNMKKPNHNPAKRERSYFG